ncbi:MAG: hypothetical protein LBN97_07955 [Oscillospiraceae bacterium]|jgi:hypothetical protein|nr:hypothetical protein [Oscillospiraceae bacterium]
MSKNAAEISARALRANTLREIRDELLVIKRPGALETLPEEIDKLAEALKREADELTKI